MDIRDTRDWNNFAGGRLERAGAQKRIAAIYGGITVGLSLLVTLVIYCLDLEINKATGLSNLGNRSMLSTVQTMLQIGQSLFLLCLDLGYLAAMLRIARGQYVSPKTLRLGFDRFWVLARSWLLQGVVYLAVGIPAVYLAGLAYLLTPLAQPLVEQLMPLMSQGQLILDEAVLAQIMSAMVPMLIFCGVALAVVCLVVSYRFRMVHYIIIDRPGMGALFAMKESRKMMKGNCWRMFRVDLKVWWYYVAVAMAAAASNLDRILAALGIACPWSEEVTLWGCYGLYLLLTFGICYFLRNRAEVLFAFAYDAVRPKEQQDGVVLGNIFQM